MTFPVRAKLQSSNFYFWIFIWFIVGLLLTIKAGFFNMFQGKEPRFLAYSAYYFSSSIIWLFLTPILLKLYRKYILNGTTLHWSVILILAIGIPISVLQRLVSIALDFGVRYLTGFMDDYFAMLISVKHIIMSSSVDSYMIYVLFFVFMYSWEKGVRNRHRPSFLMMQEGSSFSKVPISKIIGLEADKNYIRVLTATHTYRHRISIGKIAEELPPNFFRIHRSYIVNKDAVKGFKHLYNGTYQVTLENGHFVTSSESYKTAFDQLRTEWKVSVPEEQAFIP